jgi:hypothetical protein
VLPEHAPAARFSQSPLALQNWGVAWLHCVGVLFGAQTPVHAWPMQVRLFGHAMAAPHCPLVVHVCSWKSAVHLFAFGAHTPTQAAGDGASATQAWSTQVVAVACHMPSEPHVWRSVGERHCVAFGGQLPVHTPFVQTLVQAVPSFIQSPLSLHR